MAALGFAAILFIPTGAFAAVAGLERVGAATGFDSNNKSGVATCPPGKSVLSATADIGSGAGQVAFDDLIPDAMLTSVTVSANEDENGNPGSWSLGYGALCATPPPGLVRIATVSPTNSVNKGVTATCPAGKRVLGTGANITGGTSQVSEKTIVPDPTLTKVNVFAAEDQTGFAGNWSVTAYAICARTIAGLERRDGRSAIDSTNGKSATATCPLGKLATGVGGEARGAGGQVVMDDWLAYPPAAPDKMQVVGQEDENGFAGSWSVIAYAICAPASERVEGVSPTDSDSFKEVQSFCPDGKLATGAGGSIDGGVGNVSFQIQSNIYLDGSYTDAFEGQDGWVGIWTIHNFQICAPPPAGLYLATDIDPFAFPNNRSITVSCPAGRRVLGIAGATTSIPFGMFYLHDGTQLSVDSLVPNATLTSVTATGVEDADGYSGDWRLSVEAYCALPLPGLQMVSADTPEDDTIDPYQSATATCPAGKNVVGTAYRINHADAGSVGYVVADGVYPNLALTSVTANAVESTSTDSFWTVTAIAICAYP